jgi:hypothetical protein
MLYAALGPVSFLFCCTEVKGRREKHKDGNKLRRKE